jgi:hypothetical protein
MSEFVEPEGYLLSPKAMARPVFEDLVTYSRAFWTSGPSQPYVMCARYQGGVEWGEPAPPYSRLLLHSIYKWDNPPEITAYLANHPEAGAVLESAYPALLADFGSVDELALQAVADPSEPEAPELFVLVRTGDSPTAAREKLRKFESDWLMRQPSRARMLVNFDVT